MAAIYQWFIEGEVLLTTPPYAYEFKESLQPTASVENVEIIQWPIDGLVLDNFGLESAELVPVLIDTAIPEDGLLLTNWALESVELIDVLLDINPGIDDLILNNWALESAELLDILIRAQALDQDIQTSVAVEEITYVPNP